MSDMLDLATTFRVSGLFYLLMSLTTWLVLRRQDTWSLRIWCLAGSMTGVSVWLISLRGVVSDIWTYPVAQPLLLASYLLFAQSLRMSTGRAWPLKAMLWVLLLYVGIMAYGFDHRLHWGMSVLVRCTNSVALLVLTLIALDLARHERSRNAYFIVTGFALFTVSMLVNAIFTWLGRSSINALQLGWINHVMGVMSMVTLMLTYMGYLGLALERAQAENLKLQQAQWQANQWRQQVQALTQLDRQRTLSVLANSLGHGIIQPLSASRLHVELTAKMVSSGTAHVGNADVSALLSQSIEGLQRSANMVQRIRDFLRPVPRESVFLTLQTLLQDAHDLLRQELMYRGVELSMHMPARPVHVLAEALPMMQAVVQVLRNAMKAVEAQAQRKITVTLSLTAQQACIEVIDSGPGLPVQILEQNQASMQPVVDWAGELGLYMTRGILAQSGGRLLLANLPDKGARIQLHLPLAQVQPA